jgi:hypothetical protein
MNNINKSLSINETYIIDSIEGGDIFSACTALYTNALISCSGNTQIDLGENLIVFNGNTLATIISATTYYGDGSNLTGISDSIFTGGTVNGFTSFLNGISATTVSACTFIQTNELRNCDEDNQIQLLSGKTIFNTNLTPNADATLDIGLEVKRFRNINTVSGTSSFWVSTTKVITPMLDLGLDSQGNIRQITADNSILENDVLLGGIY